MEKIIQQMKKQGYRFIGNQGAVKICRWTKKSLKNEGVCYKENFYGIKSHRCCQMTPWLGCQNMCVHCWRAMELDFNKLVKKNEIKNPKEIVDEAIKQQQKLLEGFKGNQKADLKKLKQAQGPMQFAISLSGEPTLYSDIGGLIKELNKRGKTSFLVTNGLEPEILEKLYKKNQMPTQLYISVNTSNKKLYDKFHRSKKKNAWKKLNQTLESLPKFRKKTRTVFRINLVRDLNMKKEHIKEFAELIKKSQPQFIEIKGYISVGFARQRLGYERMPTHKELKDYSKEIIKELENLNEDYKILKEQENSKVLVLGKDKEELRIKDI